MYIHVKLYELTGIHSSSQHNHTEKESSEGTQTS